ncbi:PREDICTED: uncharacterized protein LOC106809757 [Priapulus caudatus]|uniref:Uncharacterized protein LOC106809757 n=1 Tax=Priapulus caudatus TaxID=37621 RepID=A0ABM1E8C3_PRICU|nr:PREDICTED: uncharacterized protein LOC106809757 [Priapulus caudatus]
MKLLATLALLVCLLCSPLRGDDEADAENVDSLQDVAAAIEILPELEGALEEKLPELLEDDSIPDLPKDLPTIELTDPLPDVPAPRLADVPDGGQEAPPVDADGLMPEPRQMATTVSFLHRGSHAQYAPDWATVSHRLYYFRFRSLLPTALLMYERFAAPPGDVPDYSLTLMLRQGQLHVMYKYDKEQSEIVCGKGQVLSKYRGCMKKVYYNAASVLGLLADRSPRVMLYGTGDPVMKCEAISPPPMTFLNKTAMAVVKVLAISEVNVDLKFKTFEKSALIVYSTVNFGVDGSGDVTLGKYELAFKSGSLIFTLQRDVNDMATARSMQVMQPFNDGSWHHVVIGYKQMVGTMRVDGTHDAKLTGDTDDIQPSQIVILGAIQSGSEEPWLMGSRRRGGDGLVGSGSGYSCNCDKNDDVMTADEGNQTDPANLPLVEATFVQHRDAAADASADLSLGPLLCEGLRNVDDNDVVTVTTSDATLVAPTWTGPQLSFYFRTANSSGVIMYQAPLPPAGDSLTSESHYLTVVLINGNRLMFQYRGVLRPFEFIAASSTPLNNGAWQYLSIEHHRREIQVRTHASANRQRILGRREKSEIRVQGTFDDGKRHLLVYTRRQSDAVLTVDAMTTRKAVYGEIVLNAVSQLWMGGSDRADDIHAGYDNYIGCMSNIIFDLLEGEDTVIRPIDVAFNYLQDENVEIRPSGGFYERACADFEGGLIIPTFPPYTTPSGATFPAGFIRGQPVTAEYAIAEPTRETASTAGSTTAIIIIVIVLVIIVGIIAIYAYMSNKQKKKKKSYEDAEAAAAERKALQPMGASAEAEELPMKKADQNSNVNYVPLADNGGSMQTRPSQNSIPEPTKLHHTQEMEELRTPSMTKLQAKSDDPGNSYVNDSSSTSSTTSSTTSDDTMTERDETHPMVHREDDPPEDLEWDPSADSTELLNRAGLPGRTVRYGNPGEEFDENQFDDFTDEPMVTGDDDDDEGVYVLPPPSKPLTPIEEFPENMRAPLADLTDEFDAPIAGSNRNSMIDPEVVQRSLDDLDSPRSSITEYVSCTELNEASV